MTRRNERKVTWSEAQQKMKPCSAQWRTHRRLRRRVVDSRQVSAVENEIGCQISQACGRGAAHAHIVAAAIVVLRVEQAVGVGAVGGGQGIGSGSKQIDSDGATLKRQETKE